MIRNINISLLLLIGLLSVTASYAAIGWISHWR